MSEARSRTSGSRTYGSTVEGGDTLHQPEGERMSHRRRGDGVQEGKAPLSRLRRAGVRHGELKGLGPKGTKLLGVRAVVAKSYERIHRSNLVGMGVLPCQFPEGVDAGTLGLDGTESFDLTGIESGIRPGAELTLVIRRAGKAEEKVPVRARIDTAVEVDYYLHGGSCRTSCGSCSRKRFRDSASSFPTRSRLPPGPGLFCIPSPPSTVRGGSGLA